MKIAMVDIVQIKPPTKSPKHKIVWLKEDAGKHWKLSSKLVLEGFDGIWKVDAILTSSFSITEITKKLS
jgi:hypothetical protein